MNFTIKQIAETLQASTQEIKEAAKVLFSPVPPTFDDSQVEKISNYLASPQQKQLPQKQNNLPVQNSGKELTNTSEDLNPYSKERSNDRIKKLISSAQLAGQSEAELFNAVKNDAFLNHAQNNDEDILNSFVNGAIAHSIQLKHVANHAGEVNNISGCQPLNIEAIEVEKVDIAQLQTSEEDIIARGFQKLLGSAD